MVIKRYHIGEKLDGWPTQSWNEIVTSIETGNVDPGRIAKPTENLVGERIRNTTTTNVPAGGVIGLGDAIHDVNTIGQSHHKFSPPIIEGVEPDADDHLEYFAVVPRQLNEDDTGVGLMFGATWVNVDITNANHTFAKPKTSEFGYLQSSRFHGVPIKWKPSGTGQKLCLVVLGHVYNGPWKAECDQDITIDMGGTIDVYYNNAATGDTVTAYLNHAHGGDNLTNNQKVWFYWDTSEQKYVIIGRECPP